MVCVVARPAVAVARAGSRLSAGAARAAMRLHWPVLDQAQPGFVRGVFTSGARVLVLELDHAFEDSLLTVNRLSRHWNPVRCVVLDAFHAPLRESLARQAGASLYLPASTPMEVIETAVTQLLDASAGTAVATVFSPSGLADGGESESAALRRLA